MFARGVLVCVLTAGCISPVMHFGGGKMGKEAQRDTMSHLGPARLATGEKWKGEVTTKKIRVWADNQFRTQNRQWQEAFERPLELANLVIEPSFGLRLVAEYVTWERHVPGSTLADDLAALEERDPGTDVFAVVGLTSSLPLASATFEDLGLAQLGGRHTILRGYNDLEERKQYANAFPDLMPEERERALVHLRHHKTAVVLLHELGHLLGVDHETDSTKIMYASYSRDAAAFSAQSRDVMLRSVDQRLHRKSATGEVVATPAAAPAQPAAQTAPAPQPPRAAAAPHAPVVIRVMKKGVIVDGKRATADEMKTSLAAIFDEDPETTIVIQEDRNLPVGAVGDVIDQAKAIGFTKFKFGPSGK